MSYKKTRKTKRLALLLSLLFTSSVCSEPCKAFALDLFPKEFSLEDAIVHLENEFSGNGFVNSYMADSDGNIVSYNLMTNLAKSPGSSDLPEKFNLNDEGCITSVKNQGNTGTCWAHSAINSAESNIIINNKADNTIDLSEAHLVYFGQYAYSENKSDPFYHEGENWGIDAYSRGGNSYYTQGTLAKGVGLVSQESDEDITQTPVFNENRRYESEWLLSNSNEYSKNDRETIKNHIMTRGALSVSYYDEDENYNPEYYSYYKSTPIISDKGYSQINHAVSIVGWDDTFSKENFKKTPQGDGAWICKNSWGTDTNNDGYFYLSYYDATIADIYSVEVVESDKYDTIYQYDGSKSTGLAFPDYVITGANMFEAEKQSVLDAVSFYTTEADVPYIITISKNDENGIPLSGNTEHIQEGNMPYAGYHIIDLSKKIQLNKGETFTVSVCLNKPGTMFIGDSYCNTKEKSFACLNDGFGWSDLSNISTGFEIAIKAFTIDSDSIDINNGLFPDATFRNYVLENCDTNKDYKLSKEEISQVTSIDVRDMGIQELTGIEYFINLETLNCSGNNLYFLDLEHNKKLKKLECNNNSFMLHDMWCDEIQMNYLDMSRISSVTGATIRSSNVESNVIYYFDPDNDAKEISYQYNCNNKFTATFTLNIDNYIHYQKNADNKCAHCNTDLIAIMSLDAQTSYCFYDDLQTAFDSAESHETVYIYLCDDVTGNFSINSGSVYLIGDEYAITSDNTEPALTVNSDSGLGIYSGIIYNTSGGKALYICKGASSLIIGGVFCNIHTENETLSDIIIKGYAFFDSNYTFINPDAQSIDVPVMVLQAYTITYELNGGTNAVENPGVYHPNGADITLSDPTRKGYKFTGWTYDGQDEPLKDVVIPNGSNENKFFTANWEEINCTEHEDSDGDEYCDICGKIANEVGAVLAGYTLSLNGNIGINFYMDLDERILSDKDAYMLFTLPNGDQKQVCVSDAVKNTSLSSEKTYYIFSCEAASYEMTQQINAQMYDSSGNSTKEYSYTVRDYARYIIEHPKSYTENDVIFAKAMLNYGACAQTYWDIATDDLANKDLDDADRIIPELTASDLEVYKASKVSNDTGTFEGYSLTLKSETTLKVYYKPALGTDINNLTFKANGQNVKPVLSGEYYTISVENIKAWDLDTDYSFEVYDVNETLSFSCSALSYCYSVLNNSQAYPDSMIQLISALCTYQQKSEIYKPE